MSDWAEVLRAQARYRVWSDRDVQEAYWSGLLLGAGIGMLVMALVGYLW